MSKTITAVRRGVALLLSPVLLLQACSAATGPGSSPSENQFDRGVVDGTIELKVAAGTVQHLVDADEASRLRDAGVIPLRLVIRNLGAREVIVESVGMTLKLNDGRVLHASAAPALRLAERSRILEDAPTFDSRSSVSETPPPTQPPADLQAPSNDPEVPPVEPPAADMEVPPVEPPATDNEALKRLGKEMGAAVLGGFLGGALVYILAAAVVTSPIWGPPVLIARYVKKKSEEKKWKVEEERLRTLSLERLEEVHLMQGEAADGLLYFAVECDRPDTLAAATLIVPIRHADTGAAHSVRLPLGVEN
jgi:hypothetical protein